MTMSTCFQLVCLLVNRDVYVYICACVDRICHGGKLYLIICFIHPFVFFVYVSVSLLDHVTSFSSFDHGYAFLFYCRLIPC